LAGDEGSREKVPQAGTAPLSYCTGLNTLAGVSIFEKRPKFKMWWILKTINLFSKINFVKRGARRHKLQSLFFFQ